MQPRAARAPGAAQAPPSAVRCEPPRVAARRAGRRRAAPRAAAEAEAKPSAATGSSLLGGGGGSGSSLLGASLGPKLGAPLPGGGASGAAKPALSLDDVPLTSGAGVDYTRLRDLLKAGSWREAEDELRARLIEAAGPGAQKRGWVYFTEVAGIPDADMAAMDGLWRAASGGRFGYSAQRELWVQARRRWGPFFAAIGWVQGENAVYLKWPQEFVYDAGAPKGHLPLTNCLRGTRLFEAILEHPAIAGAAGGGAAAAGAGGGAAGGAAGAAPPAWLK